MNERIIQIMQMEGLSPSRFAEEIGIQRAAMSHYTSGRNKPSLEVYMKILTRYPTINPDWLLFGQGEIRRAPNLSGDKAQEQTGNRPEGQGRIVFGESSKPSNPPETRESPLKSTPTPSMAPSVHVETKATSKAVDKIVLFYSDHSYEVFTPEEER